MSRSQIHRKLNKINGKSITKFIREIRLEEAHQLLEDEVATAAEIAYQVGFSSPTYFNTCFH
ncbi:MAG: helix-turn-helix transcriptional regulator, partial [Cyclobacteriaceae bacterium]|nr:helix-turn-helix transcriptional regulator [Cyclobacteriaceae bacterium]